MKLDKRRGSCNSKKNLTENGHGQQSFFIYRLALGSDDKLTFGSRRLVMETPSVKKQKSCYLSIKNVIGHQLLLLFSIHPSNSLPNERY